jgi:hypothetical protein
MRLPGAAALALLVLAAAARAATPLLSAATAIADPARDPAWSALFASLVPRENRESSFEERRYFPFRRQPVVLTGEIRLAPDRGLSLDYLTPQPRVLVVDRQGLLMRDALGREVSLPADARTQVSIAALVDILRFDLAELQRNFLLHGQRDPAGWTLAFVPRDPVLARSLAALIVRGTGDTIAGIELRATARQHIDILVRATRRDVVFTAADWARYFR